jgi:hypothetical protein
LEKSPHSLTNILAVEPECLLQSFFRRSAAPVSLRCDLSWKRASQLRSFDVKGCNSFLFRIARVVTEIVPRKSALRLGSCGMPLGSRPWSLPEAGTFMGIDPRIAAQLRVNWRIGLLPPTETAVPSVGSSMNVGRQARTSSSMAHGCPGFPSRISRSAIVNRYEYCCHSQLTERPCCCLQSEWRSGSRLPTGTIRKSSV